MLEIVYPLSVRCWTFMIYETAVTVSHIVSPLTLVYIAVSLCHPTSATHFVVFKLTYVHWTFWPLQDPKSIHH
jgi:hypothetical protein